MSDTKTDLRRAMKSQIAALDASEIADASQKICAHMAQINFAAARAAIFLATPREPNIDAFAARLQRENIGICAPISSANAFNLIAPDWSNIQINAHGWREPAEYSGCGDGSRIYDVLELDFIVLPGLAFDESGARLGQGGGWYDRALAGLPSGVLRVGVCFDFQVMDNVPREAHDQNVSVIVTEKRIIYVGDNVRKNL